MNERHEDFEKIHKKFVDLFGDEEGAKKYQDWLSVYGLDDDAAYNNQAQGLQDKLKESFNWVPYEFAEVAEGGEFWKFWAVAEGYSMNNNPYVKNLDRAARSLENRAINIAHFSELQLPFPDIRTVVAEYEDGFVETLVWVDENVTFSAAPLKGTENEWAMKYLEKYEGKKINDMLRDKDILHPSIEAVPRVPYTMEYDGDPSFIGMAFLPREFLPGDPTSAVAPLVERMLFGEQVKIKAPPHLREAITKQNAEWAKQVFGEEAIQDDDPEDDLGEGVDGAGAAKPVVVKPDLKKTPWELLTKTEYDDEVPVDDKIDWLSSDVNNIYNQLWDLEKRFTDQVDAITKRIDDAIAILTREVIEHFKENGVEMTDEFKLELRKAIKETFSEHDLKPTKTSTLQLVEKLQEDLKTANRRADLSGAIAESYKGAFLRLRTKL